MSDFPTNIPTPLFVHTFTRWGAAAEAQSLTGAWAPSAITWPVANTAFYVPVAIPWPYLVERVFWITGTSVTSTNFNFGIYTADGTLIYSTGSTAASGVSLPQYTTPGTDILLTPGRYYFALACSSITAARGGLGTTTPTAVNCRLSGILQEASAMTLPATMTPAAVSNACVPLCGVTRTTTGF